MSHLFFEHTHVPNGKGVLPKEPETAWASCSQSSLKRELFQIIRQRTAPPQCPEQLALQEQTLVVYNSAPFQNTVLCWDGFLRKTPLENSHFGSSFLHAIFPLYLIMDHTSWNKYWVAFKRQVKTTAISEKQHLAFSLYQELKLQPTGISETYSIRKLKKNSDIKNPLAKFHSQKLFQQLWSEIQCN